MKDLVNLFYHQAEKYASSVMDLLIFKYIQIKVPPLVSSE